MPVGKGLSAERLLFLTREAGNLYKRAKESDSPSFSQAAERRANRLCRDLAEAIKAQASREETEEAIAQKDPSAASEAGSFEPRCTPSVSPVVVSTDSRGSPFVDHSVLSTIVSVESQGMPSVQGPGLRASIDYGRFEAVAAAVSDSDEEVDPGKLSIHEGYRIAHRIAGVIDDVRKATASPVGAATELRAPHVATPTVGSHCAPLRTCEGDAATVTGCNSKKAKLGKRSMQEAQHIKHRGGEVSQEFRSRNTTMVAGRGSNKEVMERVVAPTVEAECSTPLPYSYEASGAEPIDDIDTNAGNNTPGNNCRTNDSTNSNLGKNENKNNNIDNKKKKQDSSDNNQDSNTSNSNSDSAAATTANNDDMNSSNKFNHIISGIVSLDTMD